MAQRHIRVGVTTTYQTGLPKLRVQGVNPFAQHSQFIAEDLKLGGKSCYDPDCNDDCVCTSFSPPGGLPRSQTPQFILVTHDDAVHNHSATNIEVTFGGLRHSNGCRVPCTFFAQASGSDADVIHSRWMLGDEFAAHAVDHVSMQHPSVGDKERRAEILGSRHWLINEANLPAEDVVGYRAPFYKGTPEQLQLIGENGFLYDASRIIMINEDEIGGRIWPYPLERGVALAKKKKRAPTYDGLWEVPAWQLAYDGQYYVSGESRQTPAAQLSLSQEHEFSGRCCYSRLPGVHLLQMPGVKALDGREESVIPSKCFNTILMQAMKEIGRPCPYSSTNTFSTR